MGERELFILAILYGAYPITKILLISLTLNYQESFLKNFGRFIKYLSRLCVLQDRAAHNCNK